MAFLNELEKRLDLPPARKAQVVQELRAHCAEIKKELVLSGMRETEASAEAERRLGDSQEVAGLLASVHNSASWRSALLAAVPFVVTAVLTILHPPILWAVLDLSLYSVAWLVWCAVSITFSVRELAAGRRPIWLATWLASALLALQHLLFMTGNSLGYDKGHAMTLNAFATQCIFCAIMLAGIWGEKRWRAVAVVVVALALAPWALIPASNRHSYPIFIAAIALSWFSAPLSRVLFALAIFAKHRYGNAAQAALFLFAMVSLGISPVAASPVNAAVLPILGCVVFLFARTPDWRRKMGLMVAGACLEALALAAAFAIVAVGDKATTPPHQASFLASAALSFIPAVVVALAAPMIYEKRRQRAEG